MSIFTEGDYRRQAMIDKEYAPEAKVVFRGTVEQWERRRAETAPHRLAARARKRQAKEAAAARNAKSSGLGMLRAEKRRHQEDKDNLRIVLMRLEGKSCVPAQAHDAEYAAELRSKIEKYEYAHRT